MVYPRRRGLRARIVERLKWQVRQWVFGHQIKHFDSPEGVRMDWDHPSYPPMRVLQALPGEDTPRIKVGKYVGIHYAATFVPGGQHHFEWASCLHSFVVDGQWTTRPGDVGHKGPIVVGNDAFVGFEALISSGVTIGDGAVVGARAVVTRDVEPYSIVVGNPAQHVKYRFDQPTREGLLRIRWWDWPVEVVTMHRDQLSQPDVAGFVAEHDPDLGPPTCSLCRGLGRT